MARLCPECWQGKHGNCDGVADITDDDVELDCQCFGADHPNRPS